MRQPNDSLAGLRSDLQNEAEVGDHLIAEVDQQIALFLDECVKFSIAMKFMDDYFAAERILTEALIWMREANVKIQIELSVRHTQPAQRGKRGGVT